ncbi:hypothetical protein PI124_g6251 [Phytophthora idaei]|nr:hypothetical protein PI125_g20236 [Phytophthora idaei]KAG3135548.1 hypothetical protein PI126_g18203 [Phytophthora idaei]KAG3249093.1 hypothetical protein PI124_g6251 [Phytophthora idaei]
MPAQTRIWWFARTLQLAYSKELHIHFKVVAAVHLHVVVYTIPDRTNVSLTQKIAELSKLPDIGAISVLSNAFSPQEVLVVTNLMLTGDYDGARKAALAPSWSSRLSSGHPVAHHEGAPTHRHVAWLLCLRH